MREDFDGEEDSEREKAEGAAYETHDVERRRVALGKARHHHERAQAEDVVDEPACWESPGQAQRPALTAAEPHLGRTAWSREAQPQEARAVSCGTAEMALSPCRRTLR